MTVLKKCSARLSKRKIEGIITDRSEREATVMYVNLKTGSCGTAQQHARLGNDVNEDHFVTLNEYRRSIQ